MLRMIVHTNGTFHYQHEVVMTKNPLKCTYPVYPISDLDNFKNVDHPPAQPMKLEQNEKHEETPQDDLGSYFSKLRKSKLQLKNQITKTKEAVIHIATESSEEIWGKILLDTKKLLLTGWNVIWDVRCENFKFRVVKEFKDQEACKKCINWQQSGIMCNNDNLEVCWLCFDLSMIV